jgi:hypothetical protein
MVAVSSKVKSLKATTGFSEIFFFKKDCSRAFTKISLQSFTSYV